MTFHTSVGKIHMKFDLKNRRGVFQYFIEKYLIVFILQLGQKRCWNRIFHIHMISNIGGSSEIFLKWPEKTDTVISFYSFHHFYLKDICLIEEKSNFSLKHMNQGNGALWKKVADLTCKKRGNYHACDYLGITFLQPNSAAGRYRWTSQALALQ